MTNGEDAKIGFTVGHGWESQITSTPTVHWTHSMKRSPFYPSPSTAHCHIVRTESSFRPFHSTLSMMPTPSDLTLFGSLHSDSSTEWHHGQCPLHQVHQRFIGRLCSRWSTKPKWLPTPFWTVRDYLLSRRRGATSMGSRGSARECSFGIFEWWSIRSDHLYSLLRLWWYALSCFIVIWSWSLFGETCSHPSSKLATSCLSKVLNCFRSWVQNMDHVDWSVWKCRKWTTDCMLRHSEKLNLIT